MAFQTGTKVDPRLLNVDYSPLIRAGEMQAQALANLGEQVGGAIKKYQADKQKKKDQEDLYNAILPYAQDYAGDQEEAEDMARTFSRDPKVGSQILQFAGIKKQQNAQAQAQAADLQALNQAFDLNAMPGDEGVDIAGFMSEYSKLGGRNPEGALEQATAYNKAVQGPGKITQDPLSGGYMQGGRFIGWGGDKGEAPKTPTAIQVAEAKNEAITTARQLAAEGKESEARDLLASWGLPDYTISGESPDVTELDVEAEAGDLYEKSIESTGIFPSLKILGQKIVGQAGIKFADAPEIVAARQSVVNAQQQLIRALSNNSRFPVAEQERIRKEIDISPGLWNDPVSLESKIKAVDKSLKLRLRDEERAANDTALPKKQRDAASAAANDIRNFISKMAVPSESGGSAISPQAQSIVDKYIKK